MWMLPYKNGSAGAGDLAKELGVKQIKREGSKFKGSKEKVVINWGSSSTTEEVEKCQVLNKPEAVAIATNKLTWMNHILRLNNEGRDYCEIPNFWTRRATCEDYIANGKKVVCRTVLNGHSGAGIVIASTMAEVVDAPLYVEYRSKKREYRVHIFGGEVVDVQRKARDHAVPDDQVNWQVRNHQNGFVYVRDEDLAHIPVNVMQQAVYACRMTGLDFCAVDVIYNEAQRFATVLEINTAPGLSGTTLEGYKQRLMEFGEAYKDMLPARRVRNNGYVGPEVADPVEPFQAAIARVVAGARAQNAAAGLPNWAELAGQAAAPRWPAPRGAARPRP